MTGEELFSRLPETIRVGPFDFSIAGMDSHQASGEGKWGTCSFANFTIKIQQDIPLASKMVDTFLHETLHAIWWAYGVADEDKEERVVSTLGTAFTALYRDNPWLAGWISEGLKA